MTDAQRLSAAKAEYTGQLREFGNVSFSIWLLDRAEAAEARAAQLETDNDEMQSYINEIRVALHTEKDELTIDAVRRVMSERDELRRQLEQAQQVCACWLTEGRFLVGNSPQQKAAVDMLREVENFNKQMKLKCKCGINDATEPHPCPYQADVNNDSETLCTCCNDCAYECAMDI